MFVLILEESSGKKNIVPDTSKDVLPIITQLRVIFSIFLHMSQSSLGVGPQQSLVDLIFFVVCFDLNSDQAVFTLLRLPTRKCNILPSALLAESLAHAFICFIYTMSLSCNYHNKDLVSSSDIAQRPNSNSIALK